MLKLLDRPLEIEDRPGAAPLKLAEPRIEFDDVHFRYLEERPILKGVSFTVEPGTKVAVVGPSGSGKSTLSRLLFRFYDVDEGAIRIGGTDIRDATQASVRKVLGVVPQDTVMFNDTIRYNLAYAEPDVDQAVIERAAERANLDVLIDRLPQGYDTIVGERGLKLSGGEKQRMAIARVMLKDPPIIVFDEATSSLDTQTEQSILDGLNDVAERATSLVIAHRLSTVVDADQILVLEDGLIVERGTHDELLAGAGLYATLWALQQGGEPEAARQDAPAELRAHAAAG